MSNETVLLAKHNIFTLALMVSTDKVNPLNFNNLILNESWERIQDFWPGKEIAEQGHKVEEYHCGLFH